MGYQAHDPEGHEHPNMTLNRLVKSVRFTGDIGVVGVYIPQDPGGPDELAKRGEIAFTAAEITTQAAAPRRPATGPGSCFGTGPGCRSGRCGKLSWWYGSITDGFQGGSRRTSGRCGCRYSAATRPRSTGGQAPPPHEKVLLPSYQTA